MGLKYPAEQNYFSVPWLRMDTDHASRGFPDTRFGNVTVVLFVLVQYLDGAMTYLGVHIWGPSIEANPLISSAVSLAGVGGGLAVAKLTAISLGVALHLRRVHTIVALLTAFYVAVAIVPWAFLFFSL